VANRYSYLPAIGLSYVLVMAFSRAGETLARRKKLKMIAAALGIFILILFATASFLRCRVWQDSITLWDDVIAKYPMIPLAYQNRAAALKAAGRLDEALADYSQALRLMPHAGFFWNRGLARLQNKQGAEAEEDFLAAILNDPEYLRLYGRMMVDIHGRSGYEAVILMGRRVLAARPDARIHVKMAEAYIRLRRWPEAEFHLREAVRLAPGQEEYRRALQTFHQVLPGPPHRPE
jgi:tetratricopeptide (TPR) repeat protein